MEQETVVDASKGVLRPHDYLLRRGVVAILALALPIAAVVYWFAIPAGGWLAITIIFLGIVLAAILLLYSFSRMNVGLDDEGLLVRGPSGHLRRIDRREVRSILLIELYQSSTLETETHLYVIGKDGRPLLRMRGRLWPMDAMSMMIDGLEAPVRVESRPLTLAELRRESPELVTATQRLFGRPG